MLEILAVTAAGLLLLAWWLRRTALRPAAVRARAVVGAGDDACASTAVLMAAPPDTSTQGRTAQPTTAGAPPARKPPKRKPSGPDRRTFLKWGMGLGWLGVLTGFGAASLAFIWPNLRGGFGAQIPAGAPEDILSEIEANEGRFEFPEARSLIVRYDPSLDPEGQYAEVTNQTNIMALYQKCVHLGCKVPWCATSQWWECPCHGSKYNRWGEWQEGPAPRGLDRFSVQEVEGQLVIDTSAVITGPSRSAAVLDQPAEGPHCQDAA
ncbi:MAG TPA: Rieske 2Fe-2S domain-containing protein [Jiangellaceae bacterium]|nr:Rieske 2Fe-2S domain-containing protein [Jiangellaceae bacterium]